jgi:hypothetical protein
MKGVSGLHKRPEFQKLSGVDRKSVAKRYGLDLNGIAEMLGYRIRRAVIFTEAAAGVPLGKRKVFTITIAATITRTINKNPRIRY